MDYARELFAAGWVLALRLNPTRGYEATAVRRGDLLRAYAPDPTEAFRRVWETAEQRDPRFECDSCGAAVRDLRELISAGGESQVCGECYVMEEAAEYFARVDHA